MPDPKEFGALPKLGSSLALSPEDLTRAAVMLGLLDAFNDAREDLRIAGEELERVSTRYSDARDAFSKAELALRKETGL